MVPLLEASILYNIANPITKIKLHVITESKKRFQEEPCQQYLYLAINIIITEIKINLSDYYFALTFYNISKKFKLQVLSLLSKLFLSKHMFIY